MRGRTERFEEEKEEEAPSRRRSRRATQTVLFVLLGFGLLLLSVGSLLIRFLLFRDGRELGLDAFVSFGLVELFGFLVEFVQVELSDDVLLVTSGRDER